MNVAWFVAFFASVWIGVGFLLLTWMALQDARDKRAGHRHARDPWLPVRVVLGWPVLVGMGVYLTLREEMEDRRERRSSRRQASWLDDANHPTEALIGQGVGVAVNNHPRVFGVVKEVRRSDGTRRYNGVLFDRLEGSTMSAVTWEDCDSVTITPEEWL